MRHIFPRQTFSMGFEEDTPHPYLGVVFHNTRVRMRRGENERGYETCLVVLYCVKKESQHKYRVLAFNDTSGIGIPGVDFNEKNSGVHNIVSLLHGFPVFFEIRLLHEIVEYFFCVVNCITGSDVCHLLHPVRVVYELQICHNFVSHCAVVFPFTNRVIDAGWDG